jgi:DNA polymerase III subunit delta'
MGRVASKIIREEPGDFMSFTGLVPQPPYPWLSSAWGEFISKIEQDRLPHALLLVAQSGLGCLDLAKAMAQYLLCRAPKPGLSCGVCKSCQLLQAESHPDLQWVQPEEDSKSIKIDQIRRMTEFTVNTAQQGGRKVIILSPAEAMNANSANALLKSLEEPSGACIFLLVTEQPAFLMATIRSRCSRMVISLPPQQQALNWLEFNRVANAERLLNQAGGRPLKVMDWLAADLWRQSDQLMEELDNLLLGKGSFLDISKNLVSYGPLWVVEQLQNWLVEALRQQNLARADTQNMFVVSLLKISAPRLHGFYDRLLKKKAWLLSSANPNGQMLMDELVMDLKDLVRIS